MQQRPEDAAQAAFNREISHYRREIPDLRAQGILYRPLVWTADGRPPEPCNTQQTLQRAATVSKGQPNPSSTDGNEIQIALLRRRAAMSRAGLPHTSARAEWLLGFTIDLVASHWIRAHPLDGDDEDGDAGTDTTEPDDDRGNIASLASQQTTAIQTSNL